MTYSCHVSYANMHFVKGVTMKIDRQLGILSILLQKESVTAPYLSEMFEVSRLNHKQGY